MNQKRNSLGQFVIEKTLSERFWSNVEIRGLDECWEWTAGKSIGYGRIWINGNVYLTPRVSYELLVGPIPDGLYVLHHCDNPGCVNPKHLFLGTQADNMADRDRKGKAAKGERHGNSRLTNAQVISIREEYDQGKTTQMKLGIKFGIASSNVGCVVRRETWKHI